MEKLTFDQKIRAAVANAKDAKPSYHAAKMAMASLDLTSLNDNDTDQTIRRLCQKALRVEGHYPAAVCVYPQFVKIAAEELKASGVQIATVVNFPFGDKDNDGNPATAENTRAVVTQAINDGATEIDIVVDYQGYHAMEADLARELLHACRIACGKIVKMKVILESSAFQFEREVYDMAQFVMDHGADMIKTSTGKHENGGASLEMVSAMAFAIRDYRGAHSAGLKISGGVNGANYAQCLALAENIMDADFMTPDLFRFGASGIYDDLQLTLETKGQVKGRTKIPKAAY